MPKFADVTVWGLVFDIPALCCLQEAIFVITIRNEVVVFEEHHNGRTDESGKVAK